MTTTTQSLVDRFNTIDPKYADRNKRMLAYDLRSLLNEEAQVGFSYLSDEKRATLNEFRANFVWDTDYAVCVEFEVYSSLFEDFPCSKELFERYIDGTLEPPTEEEIAEKNPYYADGIDTEILGTDDCKPAISVRNLRLKPNDSQKFEEEVNKVIAEITSLDADAKAKILMEIREKLVQENKVKESEPKTD